MKIRIIKESKLLQEKVEVTVNASEEDQKKSKQASKKGNAEFYFTVKTDNIKVKQVLTIKKTRPGTAKEVFEGHLSKVQGCFSEPPKMSYQGDTLDPIHQIQVDNGYVVQTPQYATNTMGQKIYSHDDNHWILADDARDFINVWSINFEIVEINDKAADAGEEYSTNPFNNLRASYAFFRKMTELVGEFVAKNPYRFYYFFGIQESREHDNEMSKRTKLYNTMLKRMYKELGGNWVQLEEMFDGEPDPNSILFFKCPGGPVTESRKEKYYLTKEDEKLIQEAYSKEIDFFLTEKIKKCKNPPCANDLSRKKWKCRGSKSMKEQQMKIRITKNKLITEGVRQTNKFLAHLKRNGFIQDKSDKTIDHSMVHILIKRSGKRDNCLVKVVLIGPDRDRFPGGSLYLSELHVEPSCRNKGHARKAMQFIMNAADTFGVRIELSAYPADDTTTKDGLHDFYTSLGFKPSGDKRGMEYHRDFQRKKK